MTERIRDVPTINLPLHGWRALHSYYVDEVLRSPSEVFTQVLDVVDGLGMEDFLRCLHARTLRPRVVLADDDRVWVFLDYAPTPENVAPALAVRAECLGADVEALLDTEYRRMDSQVQRLLDQDGGE